MIGSINLAQVDSTPEKITVHLSARSMQKGLLEDLEKETVKYFESYGCEVKSEGFYAPWKPEQTAFGQEVLNVTKIVFDEAKFGAIHAGLECGIIKEKFPEIEIIDQSSDVDSGIVSFLKHKNEHQIIYICTGGTGQQKVTNSQQIGIAIVSRQVLIRSQSQSAPPLHCR